ncbi:caspase family protein [Rhizobium ruizarguesonis]|uniref:caspase family protein n=1 Tax=Rhizobium ruizarguesonis TaxID=2081791 RepID=UPI0013EEE0EF|nr:caspase family protein [Rhizobium ruizarguesonis]
MIRNYCLSIGVRKSGRLPELAGAVEDAANFANWASTSSHGYESILITDERTPVAIADIRNAVRKIVDDYPRRLLIFYSGHGIYSQAGDQWLLSGYDRDGSEAVNLNSSMRNARRLGIGQVAVFSDACRSSIPTAGLVDGSNIFPSPTPGRAPTAPYDEFLSTDLGQAAQEFENDGSAGYGVFTKCLLQALSGRDIEALEKRGDLSVVSSETLAIRLERQVPYETGLIPNAVIQYPSITPSWRRPDDIYVEIKESEAVAVREGISVLDGVSREPPEARQVHQARLRVIESKSRRAALIEDRTRVFAAANKAEIPPGSSQGFRIAGRRPDFLLTGYAFEHMRLLDKDEYFEHRWDEPSRTVALGFMGSHLMLLPIFPGFVATIVTDHAGLTSLSYAPTDRWSNPKVQDVISEWNALLTIERGLNRLTLREFADRMRKFKHDNPALGVLAAYAYERAGLIDELVDVAWYLANENQFIPYDVFMLLQAYGDAHKLIRGHRSRGIGQYEVIGHFPMLTSGWSMIEEIGPNTDLISLRPYLRNSVWTCIDFKAVDEIYGRIPSREL